MKQPLSPVVSFGEWMPDRDGVNGGGCVVAKNCMTLGDRYIPFYQLEAIADALGGDCLGAVQVKSSDGVVYTFAGTADGLFQYAGGGWSDVSRAGGYGTSSGERWVFALYGNLLIASNYTDAMQVFELGTSTEFADITEAPKAKVVAVVNNFVVAGFTDDGVDGVKRGRVRWSGIDDPEEWTVDPSGTGADLQDLPTGGEVRAIVGYENHAIILQEREIRRMEYVGGAQVFSLTVAEPARGTVIGHSVVAVGNRVFYLSEDGFYMFSGQGSVPIGDGKIDRFYANDYRAGTENRMTASANPLQKVVMWAYVSNDSPDGWPDKILCYNWKDNRWTLIEQGVRKLLLCLSTPKGLEELEDDYGGLEDIPLGLDNEAWSGGRFLAGGVDGAGRLGFFNGAAMDAVLESGDIRINENGRAVATSVYVHGDVEELAVEVKTRNKGTDTWNYSGELVKDADSEEFCCRAEGRFHAVKVTLSGDWESFIGVQFRAKAGGVR